MTQIQRIINNRQITVHPHTTVLQACEAAGVEIPRFCYHENLSVAGNCRRCLVEIQKSPKPVVSCARPVSKGMVVFTDTPLVRKARESVLEFLLVNHPLDCPICDQGGECDLQDEVITYGTDRGRYFEFKRSVEDKECSPVVKTIMTRCIHCTRCVRFSTEVAGNEVIGAFGRGENMEISMYIHSFLKTELSGNLVDLCPVGAITTKPFMYQARSWELQSINTLDFFDAILSDIVVYKRINNTNTSSSIPAEEIQSILPRMNSLYSQNWITDRTRYAFDGLKYGRITNAFAYSVNEQTSLIDRNQAILDNVSTIINDKTSSVVVGSHSNLERVYSINAFIKIKGNSDINLNFRPSQLQLDQPFFYSLNRTVSSFIETNISGFLIVGTNLAYEASILNTIFRRRQNTSNINFSTINAYSSLRYKQTHQGNSFRTLKSFIENRCNYNKVIMKNDIPVGILLGVNSLRNSYSFFLQKMIYSLGKSFFVKTKGENRLGYLHSSVGSLAFAYFGLKSRTESSFKNKTIFTINRSVDSENFFNRTIKQDKIVKLIMFDTHYFSNILNFTKIFQEVKGMPVTSFYENEGHAISLEGRVRKHTKVLGAPKEVRNLEEILSIFSRTQGEFNWLKWNENLSRFNNERPVNSLVETVNISFSFNPFIFNNFNVNYAKFILFAQPVKNFYLQEPIAANSQVIAECSLFLGQESNFIQEI